MGCFFVTVACLRHLWLNRRTFLSRFLLISKQQKILKLHHFYAKINNRDEFSV